MGLPTLHRERPHLPVVPLLMIAIPIAFMAVSLKVVHSRNLKPVGAEIRRLQKMAEVAQTENERLAKEADTLRRQVDALQAISRVEILWGGAKADATRIAFPYARNPNATGVYMHPRESAGTVWYYTDEGDTLSRIAAHPRVLGASVLWPILAAENNMQKVSGTDPLPAGRLIRVPVRVSEAQIRRATVEAGASDKIRNEVFAQAGLKP
ncbi:MAG TPA: hypothetical protein VM052_09150 [Candidatus Limnocylindrales bacterium]|nr:hypothetical protein [Candidatus Limnocylindrales bacterium]